MRKIGMLIIHHKKVGFCIWYIICCRGAKVDTLVLGTSAKAYGFKSHRQQARYNQYIEIRKDKGDVIMNDEILNALKFNYDTVKAYADGRREYKNSQTGDKLEITPMGIIGDIGTLQGSPIQNKIQDLAINEKWFVPNNKDDFWVNKEGFWVSNKGNTEYTPDYTIFNDKNTKSKLYETYTDLCALTGSGMTKIMPTIIDVKSINEKVVIIEFADGTTEKSILADGDTFSLEHGIEICLMKKLLSDLTHGNGNSVYHKLVDYAMNRYNRLSKWEQEEAEREKAEKEAKRTLEGKREKKRAKRKEKEIAEYTDILAQAISKAIQSCPNLINDNSVSKNKK